MRSESVSNLSVWTGWNLALDSGESQSGQVAWLTGEIQNFPCAWMCRILAQGAAKGLLGTDFWWCVMVRGLCLNADGCPLPLLSGLWVTQCPTHCFLSRPLENPMQDSADNDKAQSTP